MELRRLLARMLGGNVANVSFVDLVRLIEAFGFRETSGRGSHRVFARAGVDELVNLQTVRGQAKPYQVRQVTALIRKYDLHLEEER